MGVVEEEMGEEAVDGDVDAQEIPLVVVVLDLLV